ncbi:hypothetical protein ES692_04310 [Psychroserpens burtonensis]|uniref:DUF6418 domain-containing protein n=2 Tax=Psychroserpens burtonensis TaxID=49278 RepID=A0A5C7B9R1_9FLAO|nr:DUF6418 domain-containing protein [Psychroserpens burtonensis]TXE19086.1 hypothetical protein ES692_04310 [Psychroserpens burtonensis]
MFLYAITRKDYKIVFLFGLLVFQGLTIIPSLIYLEEGIYISEQGRDSFFVGATFMYVMYFFITFTVIFMVFELMKRFKTSQPVFRLNNNIVDEKIIFYIVVFTLLILYYNASQSRLPLFDPTVTRFTYWPNSKLPFLNKILGNTSIFIPFILGLIYKNNKTKCLILLALYFVYNFLIGQKFSPIILGFFSFFLPMVLVSERKINFKRYINMKTIIVIALIVGSVYTVIYKRYERRRPYAVIKIYDPNEAMFYRAFGLQGHLMWGTVETYVYNDKPHSYNPLDLSYGMQHLMREFAAKKSNLDKAISNGFNFTNGYPSILFYTYPIFLALILHILVTAILIAFPGWLLIQFIKARAYVMAVILFQFFNWAIYAITMGYFYKFNFIIGFLLLYGAYTSINYKNKIKLKRLR